ncbi:MAG: adenosine deaminase [Bacteroidales bacterium]|jgi:adenosine deaminase|nr:adenosine deaminase [Bacteroidales bacterium]
MIQLDKELIRKLPKAEIHCHLDGSMRISTIMELARQQKVRLPADNERDLRRILEAGMNVSSLTEYLKLFDITLSVLQEADALTRATYELGEDCTSENVRYLEIRFAPILHTQKGLRLNEVINAVLKGKEQAEQDFNIKIGIIISSIRHNDPQESLISAELAVAYKNSGIVGFDLAGAEQNYPVKDHQEAFQLINNNNINITVHAGEAYGPESIHQAIHLVNANRIGHGTRLRENGDLLNYVNDRRIPLEMCITSNLQTKAVKNIQDHPFRFYLDLGLRATVNTDNRLISSTTLTDEYMLAINSFNLEIKEVVTLILNGFKSAFLPYAQKADMIRRVILELKQLGLVCETNDYL